MANFLRWEDTAINADQIKRIDLDPQSGVCQIQFGDGEHTLILRDAAAKSVWAWVSQESVDITKGKEGTP